MVNQIGIKKMSQIKNDDLDDCGNIWIKSENGVKLDQKCGVNLDRKNESNIKWWVKSGNFSLIIKIDSNPNFESNQ